MKNKYILLLSVLIVALFAIPGLARATGVGSSSQSVTTYSNGSQVGYRISNLTVGGSEMLNFNNNTKTENITITFINSTSIGITANNKTYNLTIGNPTVLTDMNSYTGYAYYVELIGTSYPNITLLVYGQPPPQPVVVVVNTTTTLKVRNITQQKQPTTIPSTTIPVSTTIVGRVSSILTPSLSYLMVALVIVLVLWLLIYYSTARSRGSVRNK